MAVTEDRPFGKSIKRREDPRFIQGRGSYVANLVLPKMAYLAIKRSPYAHARIKSINTARARNLWGVIDVFTGEDTKDAERVRVARRKKRRVGPLSRSRTLEFPVAIDFCIRSPHVQRSNRSRRRRFAARRAGNREATDRAGERWRFDDSGGGEPAHADHICVSDCAIAREHVDPFGPAVERGGRVADGCGLDHVEAIRIEGRRLGHSIER